MATKVDSIRQFITLEEASGKIHYFNKAHYSIVFRANEVVISSELLEESLRIPLTDFQGGDSTPYSTEATIIAYMETIL